MDHRSTGGRNAPLVLLLALAAFLPSCGESGPALPLRLKLRKGSVYRIMSVTEQAVIDGGKMMQRIGLWTRYSIEDVDGAGVAAVRVTYDSAVYEGEGPAGRERFTSADTSSAVPPGAAGYMAIVGQGFTMQLAPDGHVRRIDGGDALRNAIADRLTGSNKFMAGVVDSYMRTIFSDRSLREAVEQALAIYPADAVAVGGSWESAASMVTSFPMTLRNRYELASRQGGVAMIELESEIVSRPADSASSSPIASFEYDLQGKQKGTLKVREEDGWLIASDITQEFSGTIRQGEGADSTRKTGYPVSVRGSVTTRLIEE